MHVATGYFYISTDYVDMTIEVKMSFLMFLLQVNVVFLILALRSVYRSQLKRTELTMSIPRDGRNGKQFSNFKLAK